MNHVRFQINRQLIEGKTIVGIDPAKEFHHAAVVDAHGTQVGNSFSFPASALGYREILWHHLARIVPAHSPEELAFAIETSCNLSGTRLPSTSTARASQSCWSLP